MEWTAFTSVSVPFSRCCFSPAAVSLFVIRCKAGSKKKEYIFKLAFVENIVSSVTKPTYLSPIKPASSHISIFTLLCYDPTTSYRLHQRLPFRLVRLHFSFHSKRVSMFEWNRENKTVRRRRRRPETQDCSSHTFICVRSPKTCSKWWGSLLALCLRYLKWVMHSCSCFIPPVGSRMEFFTPFCFLS